MSWQPIDFQSIVVLDNPVIDHLHQYLDEQESLLARSILESVPYNLNAPALPISSHSIIKLSEAIDTFSKKCSQSLQQKFTPSTDADWQIPAKQINKALWKYVEVLEGCVAELFQQLDQIGLEQWHSRLSDVVGTIKELLQHKIEDLVWSIKRLEDQLWKCRAMRETGHRQWSFWQTIQRLWSPILDKELLKNLDKSQTYLRINHNKFLSRYGSYVKLQEEAEKSLDKFETYSVLASQDRESQHLFKKIYQLLKLWEMNKTAKAVPSRELVIALRHAVSIEKATSIFRYYYSSLKNLLFDQSRNFKALGPALLEDSPTKDAMLLEIENCHAEIHTLGATISNYRDFLLRADPDPYVRSRLGFSEWVVGPEPAQTKPLLELGYDVEHLDDLCSQLSEDLQKDLLQLTKTTIEDVDPAIQSDLHEMSQPLANRRIMKAKAQDVLEKLQQIDEWGSFSNEVVDYTGKILSRLLRVDWKYHVLFEYTSFQQLYSTHQGLVTPVSDRSHANRLMKFTKLLNQIQDWVTRNRTQSHFHDIELDMNDIKGYLQDFLASVQRLTIDQSLSKERADYIRADISQQLLEYRHLFGNFFYHLRQNESEGQLIRRQFLFVDQYFETVELKLQELENKEFDSNPPTEEKDEG